MTVRRIVGFAVALLLPALPSTATTPSSRVVSVSYSLPGGYTTGDDATLSGSPTATGIAQADEDRVTVDAADVSGLAALVVDVTPVHGVTARFVTCGSMVVGLNAGTTVEATPVAGRCASGAISTPQGGTVLMTFHKRPRHATRARRPAPRVAAAPPAAPTAAPTSTAPPELRWAVLIGIRDYAGRTHSTVGGVNDVLAIRKALLESGWRNDHILLLRDADASARNIRWAFDWLAGKSSPRTFSLLHFSGHVCIASRGPCARGHAYLWAQDNRFVPDSEVKARMRKVRGYSWLDVAACESGAFDLHSASRLFTSSSRASETSYESRSWKQSYWTGLVWDRGFLQGNADDRRLARQATIFEMVRYGGKNATALTRKGPRGAQHPQAHGGAASWTIYAPPGG